MTKGIAFQLVVGRVSKCHSKYFLRELLLVMRHLEKQRHFDLANILKNSLKITNTMVHMPPKL